MTEQALDFDQIVPISRLRDEIGRKVLQDWEVNFKETDEKYFDAKGPPADNRRDEFFERTKKLLDNVIRLGNDIDKLISVIVSAINNVDKAILGLQQFHEKRQTAFYAEVAKLDPVGAQFRAALSEAQKDHERRTLPREDGDFVQARLTNESLSELVASVRESITKRIVEPQSAADVDGIVDGIDELLSEITAWAQQESSITPAARQKDRDIFSEIATETTRWRSGPAG